MSYRAPVVGNRICDAAWHARTSRDHHDRVNSIRPVIDISPPVTYQLNLNRSKREVLHEEHYRQIDRENQILLRKMTDIIRHPSPFLEGQNQNHMKYIHSLNSAQRRKELQRIMLENQGILQRISARKAFYRSADWDRHAESHELYLESMAQKPVSKELVHQLNHSKERVQSRVRTDAESPKSKSRRRSTIGVQLAQEGRDISGRYVIVTVEELTEQLMKQVSQQQQPQEDDDADDPLEANGKRLKKLINHPPPSASARSDSSPPRSARSRSRATSQSSSSQLSNLSAPSLSSIDGPGFLVRAYNLDTASHSDLAVLASQLRQTAAVRSSPALLDDSSHRSALCDVLLQHVRFAGSSDQLVFDSAEPANKQNKDKNTKTKQFSIRSDDRNYAADGFDQEPAEENKEEKTQNPTAKQHPKSAMSKGLESPRRPAPRSVTISEPAKTPRAGPAKSYSKTPRPSQRSGEQADARPTPPPAKRPQASSGLPRGSASIRGSVKAAQPPANSAHHPGQQQSVSSSSGATPKKDPESRSESARHSPEDSGPGERRSVMSDPVSVTSASRHYTEEELYGDDFD